MSRESEFQQQWMSLTEEEKFALFAFIDSPEDGATRSWIVPMIIASNSSENALSALVAKNIVEVSAAAPEDEEQWYKLVDAQFYHWLIETFTKPQE